MTTKIKLTPAQVAVLHCFILDDYRGLRTSHLNEHYTAASAVLAADELVQLGLLESVSGGPRLTRAGRAWLREHGEGDPAHNLPPM